MMMKALAFKVPQAATESFRLQEDDVPHFYDRLHHHPELQLTLILSGHGTQLVGDSIQAFQAGDLLLIGAHLPHVFRNAEVFYHEASPLRAKAISVFFSPQSFGEGFLDLPEALALRELLRQAGRGIRIKGELRQRLVPQLHSLAEYRGFRRLLSLLSMLHDIASAPESLELLSSIRFEGSIELAAEQDLKAVLQYVMDHYHRAITLSEVAAVANRSVSAFCRYFKLHTRKTFVRFLNEVRVGAACRLLGEQGMHISEISYAVGFQNLSNFNRQFRGIKGMTPTEYLRVIKGE
ncbi:MAG: AraC family transcriptional regulator [Bacteroidota bacterium]